MSKKTNKLLNRNKISRFRIFIITILLILTYIYSMDIFWYGGNIKFNFKVANYHLLNYCLFSSNFYSFITKKNSNVSYFLRNMLYHQYYSIKKSSIINLYNAIGTFYSINNDFKFLYSINENNKGTSIKEKCKYQNYKKIYIKELKEILGEYQYRNYSTKNFLHLGTRDGGTYRIPNRIIFYLDLAICYIQFSNIERNAENLEFLEYILNSYDIIYKQEYENDTEQYKSINYGINKKQFDSYYGKFLYCYSKNIILIEHELYPNKNICNESNICNKYMESLTIYKKTLDQDIRKIMSIN